jgi:YVTN family beta-propeller protein
MSIARTLVISTALAAAAPALAADGMGADASRLVRQGLAVEFSAAPLAGAAALSEGEFAELRFRITEEATGKPVRGLAPGAWMDMADVIRNKEGAEQKSCKDKIALYLKGVVGIRPMVDLNSYYVVVMNQDASLAVIDPTVSMAGRTSTLAQIPLASAGADWAQSADGTRLFVTMPASGKLAVIDTERFRAEASVPAGSAPTRAVLQPDGRYLWIGNNARDPARSGVTVIDADTLKVAATLATGAGHHEIAVSEDSRYALATNRDDGTATLVDVRTLRRVRDYRIGGVPIAVGYSPVSKAFYVADARGGAIHVLRPDADATAARIALRPGLGPMRFTPDGRFLLALNPAEDLVHVIDAATNGAVHELHVQGQPFQVAFTRAFAYVRALGSERVSMIDLGTLGAGRTPAVLSFAAGALPPKAGGELALASAIAPAAGEAGALVVSPAEGATYFYMEGMNATSSSYKAYGSAARAVTVVDRALREVEPGVYASKVKLPAAGRYDVAFSLDAPRLLHCFSATAEENPALAAARQGYEVEFLLDGRDVATARAVPFRFRVVDRRTGKPVPGLADVRVRRFQSTGRDRDEVAARERGDGVYEADVTFPVAGTYYVHVLSAALAGDDRNPPFIGVRARDALTSAAAR